MRPEAATRAVAVAVTRAPVFKTNRPDTAKAADAILALADHVAAMPVQEVVK
jgi:hypothetical protein